MSYESNSPSVPNRTLNAEDVPMAEFALPNSAAESSPFNKLTGASSTTLPARGETNSEERDMEIREKERKSFHQKLFKTPKETGLALVTAARLKADMRTDRTMLLAFISGVLLSFGGTFAIMAAKGSPDLGVGFQHLIFGMCFHVGMLFMVVFGGELFTANMMVMTLGWLGGSINWKEFSKSLIISFFLNFLGCVFGAIFLVYFGEVFSEEPYTSAVQTIAETKVGLAPQVVFLRAISANWLATLGVFVATSAETVEGKFIASFVSISAFGTSGYEHAVANMYFIPLGLVYGAQTTFGEFLYRNLILTMLGNYVGAGIFVGAATWWLYVREAPLPPKALKKVSHKGKQFNLLV